MPLNDSGRNACLTGGLGNVAIYASAHTGIPDNTGSSEATGGSPAYARQSITWATASAGTRANSGALTSIDVAAGTYFAVGLWSAVTVGTFYGWLPINGTNKGYGAVDTAAVTSNVINSPTHGLVANDRIILNTVFAGSLPSGLNATSAYYVIATGLTTDAFSISTTLGGAAVDITGSGEFFWQKIIPETFAAQGQISVASGALVLDLTGI